jgi:hypothetical protein
VAQYVFGLFFNKLWALNFISGPKGRISVEDVREQCDEEDI